MRPWSCSSHRPPRADACPPRCPTRGEHHPGWRGCRAVRVSPAARWGASPHPDELGEVLGDRDRLRILRPGLGWPPPLSTSAPSRPLAALAAARALSLSPTTSVSLLSRSRAGVREQAARTAKRPPGRRHASPPRRGRAPCGESLRDHWENPCCYSVARSPGPRRPASGVRCAIGARQCRSEDHHLGADAGRQPLSGPRSAPTWHLGPTTRARTSSCYPGSRCCASCYWCIVAGERASSAARASPRSLSCNARCDPDRGRPSPPP